MSTGEQAIIDQLIASAQIPEAVSRLERLALNKDVSAMLRLAEMRFFGRHVAKDVKAGRRLYEKAAAAGDPMAGEFVTNLLASGIGGERNWRKAVRRLQSEAGSSSVRKKSMAVIKDMVVDRSGNPLSSPSNETIHQNPLIRIFPQFLSMTECEYLVERAERFMSPSVIFDIATGMHRPDPVRTSSQSVFIPLFEDPAIHAINRRISVAANVPVNHGEPLQILRYTPGQEFKRHVDADVRLRNMRIKTFLIWLSDGYAGGDTIFHRLGLTLRGGSGDAVMFENVLEDGSPDPISEHSGAPVLEGVKYIASRWLCAKPFDLRE